MCNIETLVFARKASTADLMVSRETLKTPATSNAVQFNNYQCNLSDERNATLKCGDFFKSRVSWF